MPFSGGSISYQSASRSRSKRPRATTGSVEFLRLSRVVVRLLLRACTGSRVTRMRNRRDAGSRCSVQVAAVGRTLCSVGCSVKRNRPAFRMSSGGVTLSVIASSGRSLIRHADGFAPLPRLRPKTVSSCVLPDWHGARKDVLDLRLIGDDQPVRMAAAEGEVVERDEVVAVLRRDEIDERVLAVVVAVGGELLAVGVAEQRGWRRVANRAAGPKHSTTMRCPFFAAKRNTLLALLRGAVDDAVDGTTWAVARSSFGSFSATSVSPRETANSRGLLTPYLPTSAHVVGAGRHVRGDRHRELAVLDVLRLDAGVIEEERRRLFDVGADNLDLNRRPGRAPSGVMRSSRGDGKSARTEARRAEGEERCGAHQPRMRAS